MTSPRIVVGTLADTPPRRKKAKAASVSPRFVHPLPLEDQTGLVIHHDLTPEAQAQIAQVEKMGESIRTALYTIAAVVVVVALVSGLVYASRTSPEEYYPRRKKRRKRRLALAG